MTFDPDPAFDAAFDKLAKELGMKTEMQLQCEERLAAQQNATAKMLDATLAARGINYGTFASRSRVAQAIKAAMADSDKWERLAPDQRESLEMIAHKISRIVNGNPDHHDSWHDIAGYAQLVADRIAGNER